GGGPAAGHDVLAEPVNFQAGLLCWEAISAQYPANLPHRRRDGGNNYETSLEQFHCAKDTVMPRKYAITYHDAPSPIRELVTKFGGQPVWIAEPHWPLGKIYETPMQFVCQIAAPDEIIGDGVFRMAYLFMTDWDGESLFPNTFDPDGGENALII